MSWIKNFKCIHFKGYLVKDIMSLVMVMQFNHYDDHLFITTLARQVIPRIHFWNKAVRKFNNALPIHGKLDIL
jgi:hypothetical protein